MSGPAKTLGDGEGEQRLRAAAEALEGMAVELSMAFDSVHRPAGTDPRMTSGFLVTTGATGSRVQFTSFAHRRSRDAARESDQNELGYSVEAGSLMRGMKPRRDGDFGRGGVERTVLSGVGELRVELLDGLTLEWVERWDSREGPTRARLPRQVRIALTLSAGDDGEAVTLGTRALLPLEHALNHASYR